MNIIFSDLAWEEYTSWVDDRKMLKRINKLIKDIQRLPFEGLGKPEPLKYNLSGCWSRRIDDEHRLIYYIEDDAINIISCRYHYQK